MLSEYAVGDVVYIPPGAACILDERVYHPGLWRVESVFSIGEDASYYYRVSPARLVPGRSALRLELVTEWDEVVSNRVHVIPGHCDYTAGWVRLYQAAPTMSPDKETEQSALSS